MKHFSAYFCLGPFKNITSENISTAASEMVLGWDRDAISDLWENFGFVDIIFEDAYGESGVDSDQEDAWFDIVKRELNHKLYEAAEQIYLSDRYDAVWVTLDGKNWIVTGGMGYGEFPTEAAEYIKLISFTGLDKILSGIDRSYYESGHL